MNGQAGQCSTDEFPDLPSGTDVVVLVSSSDGGGGGGSLCSGGAHESPPGGERESTAGPHLQTGESEDPTRRGEQARTHARTHARTRTRTHTHTHAHAHTHTSKTYQTLIEYFLMLST